MKLERAITLQKRNVPSTEGESLSQATWQRLALNNRLIDPERTIGRKLHDDCFRKGASIRTCEVVAANRPGAPSAGAG